MSENALPVGRRQKRKGFRRSLSTLADLRYRPEYCQMLDKHLAEGWSFASFGGVVGAASDVLYRWRHLHPEFDEVAKKYKRKHGYYNLSFP